MESGPQYGLFFGIVLGVVMLPGIDMTFLLATTIASGRKSGLAGISGIIVAAAIHVAVGAAGLAALLLVVPALWNAMLIAGALYLGWIGWSLLRGGAMFEATDGAQETASLWTAFRRGLATNLLNPKAYAFMLAVFPQFIHLDRGSIALQALPLWAIIAVTQFSIYGLVVLAADGARGWLQRSPRALVVLGRCVGVLLLVVAALSAWQGWAGAAASR